MADMPAALYHPAAALRGAGADEFIAELKTLRISADAESATRVFNGVHRLAVLDHRLTSYDAAYLELALRYGLPLATLDEELIAASVFNRSRVDRASRSSRVTISTSPAAS